MPELVPRNTATYLNNGVLFVSDALAAFMILASKGAAGVTGAGLATLAGGLQTHRPDLVGGVGLIVGIDRFMSEARALTNFAGNAIATVFVGTWTNDIDRAKVTRVLAGDDPFDETVLVEDDAPRPSASTASAPARAGQGTAQTGAAPIAVSANQEREASPVR